MMHREHLEHCEHLLEEEQARRAWKQRRPQQFMTKGSMISSCWLPM